MPQPNSDFYGTRRVMTTLEGEAAYASLVALAARFPDVSRLPYSLKILLESLLRNCDGARVTEEDVVNLATWKAGAPKAVELPFMPSRVILQDFTGVPCVVDLAAMRAEVARRGGDPARINPLVPVDLVVDHSVQVDAYGSPDALERNMRREFERNRERYAFLKWGARAFRNLRIIPPGNGIVHQVNLEVLADVVSRRDGMLFPDTLVGTDSHTTMINGLGVVGWGVGGIEAEAAMLGQPVAILAPNVTGVGLYGALREGVTATDLVLTVTQMLRAHGVVDKFVEFYGPGAAHLSLADRATIANMAPEYGATVGYFPIDDETVRYLRATGRGPAADRVERYAKTQGLWREEVAPLYSETLMLDLSKVEPSLAGPKRPQDRVPLAKVPESFQKAFPDVNGQQSTVNCAVKDGDIVIAAITSCTNTSNPSVMLAAGLLAQKAVERGLAVPKHVKTSLAPGSKAVKGYLEAAGLMPFLEKLRFHVVGYGCTTCIGNSGPLDEPVAKEIKDRNLTVAAVLSGNRNFEGRVHAQVKANYLASPPLVVAYALAGRIGIDFEKEPLGIDADGRSVFLRDLWPKSSDISEAMHRAVTPELYRTLGRSIEAGSEAWEAVAAPSGDLFAWEPDSTYVREAPFALAAAPETFDVRGARALLVVGDSITTDHVSPAGAIAEGGAAARYLGEHGVEWKDFNSYGARRGNHEVMVRGTFAKLQATHWDTGETLNAFDAAERYRAAETPAVILAGKDYGMGSSRDWAAKGPKLLGVRAVLFESVERIHRSNLVGMGILPLQFEEGETAASLGLTGAETFDLVIPPARRSLGEGGSEAEGPLRPKQRLSVTATSHDGTRTTFHAILRIDTPVEVEYMKAGGIIPYVLKSLL